MKWFRYGLGTLFLFSLFFLPEPNEEYLFLQTVRGNAERALIDLLGSLERGEDREPAPGIRLDELVVKGIETPGAAAGAEREIRRFVVQDLGLVFQGLDQIAWRMKGEAPARATPEDLEGLAFLSLEVRAEAGVEGGSLTVSSGPLEFQATFFQPYFKWYSILPPFLAILLALLFQRPLFALFLGVWLGATLMERMNPVSGLARFAGRYFYEQALLDQFRLDIIGFVIALCATVGVMTRGGGVQGLVKKIMTFARSVRSTQMVTYFMGLALFFDDYANCIIVGNTARPLTDRMKISREKLAYLVDSTAAPVAGLSMLSTWIAYEVSTFAAQLPEAGIRQSAYEIFFQTIPYRFYCILTLLFIAMVILLQRDFGPMFRAEKRARETGEVIRPGGLPLVSSSMTRIEAKEGKPARWGNAFFPVLCIVLVTIEELWRMGGGWERSLGDLFSAAEIRDVLGNASDVNSARPIFAGSLAGLGLAAVLVLAQRILTVREVFQAAFASTRALVFAVGILFLAWCIGGVCVDLGTAHYLIALFKGVIDPVYFPTILFLTSCAVSFATGSSWSTMSILLPNTVILSVTMGEMSPVGPLGMLVISIGAVLEGSIFGDHCSPISDTTILSSVSSASDHMDHVKTQIPYAVCCMAAAVLAGYLPAAMGVHPAFSLITAALLLLGMILWRGKRSSA